MKHKIFRLLVLCCIGLVSATTMAQTDATSRDLLRQESAQVFDGQENYAVIVGVDSYDLATPLNYAVADAKRLAAFFESQGYVVDLLLNNDATPTRIIRRLRTVGDVATNGGSAQQGNLVFAFSGHGFREEGVNYLATGETDPDQIQSTALSLTDVQRTLRETGVRQRVLFIDACRNDPAKGRSYENGTFEPDTSAEGEAILYSTRSGTLSWEDSGLGHGVFTHYLVQGLEGAATGEDGLVSFNDLQRYVVGEVKRHVLQRFNKSQIPYIGGERTGEFVVARLGSDRIQPDPVPQSNSAALEKELGLSREERRRVQLALNAQGQDVGVPDGIFGDRTRTGIRNWRESNGLEASEFLDSRSYKLLVAELAIDAPVVTDVPTLTRRAFEPEMVRIEGGEFEMGSRNSDHDDERPVRNVQVSTFEMGKYEVTIGQFRAFITSSGHITDAQKNPDEGCAIYSVKDSEWQWSKGKSWENAGFEQGDDHPVVCVSWNDAQSFVQWLNENTTGGYRLASEAEWEYAARAGSTGKYHFGESESSLCEYGNGADKSTAGEFSWSNQCTDDYERTAPAGNFKANKNGLYDMHGNVWEWAEDCWHENYEGAPSNGRAWVKGGDCGRRVLRGGSWIFKPGNLRSADRGRLNTSNRSFNSGFRVSRTLTP